MSQMVCPHCHGNVPHGAKVCTGCQAEVEYGAPGGALLFALLLAVMAGWFVGNHTHSIVGWGVFAVVLGVGGYGCSQIFKGRVNFKRVYRTR